MTVHKSKAIWLNDIELCGIDHLAEVSGLSVDEIEDLVETGVIVPANPNAQPQYFHLRYVVTVNTARRLRDDFQLDRHGLSLALRLLRRIEELETQLASMDAKRSRP